MTHNMPQDMDRGPQSLRDYVDFLRRRKWYILAPWLLIAATAAAVSVLLPPVYRSTATILIESQQVPQDLIRTTVTGYAEERINTITQQMLSRQVLLNLMTDFNLYPDQRGKVPVEEILEDMREDIAIEMVSAEVPDRRGGRPVTVNVAFTVSYEGVNPQTVMQVANRLTSLFLEHNLRMRGELAQTTTTLLEKQLEQYRVVTRDLEGRIARFKEAHMAELPELMQLNVETERELKRQIESLEEQARTLEDRKVLLEGQLASVTPDVPLMDASGRYVADPKERLKLLKTEAISLEATLSPKHPDVIKLRSEIAELEKNIGPSEERYRTEALLRQKVRELEDLKTRATDKHPDVQRLRNEIEDLTASIKALADTGAAAPDPGQARPTNPAYINIETQIKVTEIDLEGLKDKKRQIEARWQDYVRRLEKMPEVEREYRELTRDYDTAQRKYAETTAKLMEARQGESLEESRAGEKFTIVDPPQLPEAPIKPKRLAIALIGLILGIGAGISGAAVREFADRTIRTQKDVRRITGQPVLATIPDVQAVQKMRGRR